MIVRVTEQPSFTIDGDNYSASVPVGVFDDNNWAGEQTILVITGLISEANFAQAFIVKLKDASASWKASLELAEVVKTRLSGIIGKIL